MTKERMSGILLRVVMVPVLLLLICFALANISLFSKHANQTKEITSWVPIITNDYTIEWKANRADIIAVFSYEYEGEMYTVEGFSPFPELTEEAGENTELVQRILSKDHDPIVIYVNPDNPEMASMATGWARPGYSDDVSGGVVLSLALLGLYFALRREPRVQDLIPE